MIFGVLIAKKSYSLKTYFCVLMIVLGVGMFMFKSDQADSTESFWNYGILFIGFSLLADGLHGASQDAMIKISKPSAFNYMLFVNMWSSLFLLVALVPNCEAIEFVNFIMRHYEVLLFMGVVVVTGSFGQYFLSSMVTNFGPLSVAIVTTLRKFFTVLLSCFIFSSELSIQQWIATLIIFGALTLDVILEVKEENNIKDNNVKQITT